MSLEKKEKITKIVILSSVFGLLAAFAGSFFIYTFLAPPSFFVQNNSNQEQEFLKTSLGVKAYGKLEVFEFLDKTAPAVVSIYKKKPGSGALIDRLYLEEDRLGLGFALTSDGWIITDKSALGGQYISRLAVQVKDSMYNIEDVAYDSWTDIVFLKIKAQELPAVSLGDSSTLKLGDIVFSGSGKNDFWFSFANSINLYEDRASKNDAVISSERFGKTIKTQGPIPMRLNGAMIADRRGVVVGIAVVNSKESKIIPVNYFSGIISSVLKNKKVSRPYLGVNYIDLSSVSGENLPGKSGSYVYGGGFLRSVELNSPAQKAGLVVGDMILVIDGEEVGKRNNLSEIISQYKAGDKINLKVLRGGQELELAVELGEK